MNLPLHPRQPNGAEVLTWFAVIICVVGLIFLFMNHM